MEQNEVNQTRKLCQVYMDMVVHAHRRMGFVAGYTAEELRAYILDSNEPCHWVHGDAPCDIDLMLGLFG